jgi:hypothetical protein
MTFRYAAITKLLELSRLYKAEYALKDRLVPNCSINVKIIDERYVQ